MTTDDFTTAARAEAEKRYRSTVPNGLMRVNNAISRREFTDGAVWARNHLARQEASDLDELSWRLSLLLDNCTGGRMSKPNYTVDAMIREIEDHYEREHEANEAEREPEDAEVEAAARALAHWDGANRWGSPEYDGEIPESAYRYGARKALAAAREARP